MTQNVPAEYPVAPTKIEGVGDSVVFVELEDKLTTFTSKHSGESNFIVKVDGDNLLVNEIGHYEGSVAKKVDDRAVYVISVHADGKWEIAID
ncbi:hypothetical protein [Numidum massiliense]|uniref:hypothetical protein n=1 Tax=Numidum massiliense TaxID=1522315 RepID=UPI00164E6EA9|nr:hypothetical protein [Numidum massiliense]